MIKKAAEPHTTDAATAHNTIDRNQYPEILPYDHNRVVLTAQTPDSSHDDHEPHASGSHQQESNAEQDTTYINASYIDVSWAFVHRRLDGLCLPLLEELGCKKHAFMHSNNSSTGMI